MECGTNSCMDGDLKSCAAAPVQRTAVVSTAVASRPHPGPPQHSLIPPCQDHKEPYALQLVT